MSKYSSYGFWDRLTIIIVVLTIVVLGVCFIHEACADSNMKAGSTVVKIRQVLPIGTGWSDKTAFVNDLHCVFRQLGLPSESTNLLIAHIALSSGWGNGVYNWNLSGIKLCWGCEGKYDFFIKPGVERRNGKLVKKLHKWRSFRNLKQCAKLLHGSLKTPRYRRSYAMLLVGDVEYFAQVGRDGWYSADPVVTKAKMVKNLRQVIRVLNQSDRIKSRMVSMMQLNYVSDL